MVNRALANAGPSLSQHAKSVQKELALADAREKEAKKSKETIAANTKRVSVHLLKSLASQLDRFGASAEGGPGPGADLTAGWTVEFNLARVSGDPEGVLSLLGQPISRSTPFAQQRKVYLNLARPG